MNGPIEREIKLRFENSDEARAAVGRTGATPLRGRRLQEDVLLDTDDEVLRRQRCVLRVRNEGHRNLLTFKGPSIPGPVKIREELETMVGDADTILHVFERLGYHIWFRYQKYREEYAFEDVVVAVDETPIGTFVEIEGTEPGIATMANALGRGPADYILDSYHRLFLAHREATGLSAQDMVFDDPDRTR
jgi:adenylate cyclase, class 2